MKKNELVKEPETAFSDPDRTVLITSVVPESLIGRLMWKCRNSKTAKIMRMWIF